MGGKCQTTGPSVTGGFKSPSDGLYSKILLSIFCFIDLESQT